METRNYCLKACTTPLCRTPLFVLLGFNPDSCIEIVAFTVDSSRLSSKQGLANKPVSKVTTQT